MQPNGSIFLGGDSGRLYQPNPLSESNGPVEQALYRARVAFDAGWQLTPSEVVALVDKGNWPDFHTACHIREAVPDTEDDLSEIPLYFSET